jgi:hypothetical protein
MATDGGNGGNNGGWWKSGLTAFGAVVAGGLLTWTGIKADLDANAKDVVRLQIRQDQQGQQLDRVEGKIDRLLRVREAKP